MKLRRRRQQRPAGGRKKYFVWFAITGVLWLLVAGSQFWIAKGEVERGEESLRVLIDDPDPTTADLARMSDLLESSGAEFRSASDRLSSPLLYPLRPLPFVGRQFSSVRALAESAAVVVEQIEPIVQSAQMAQDDPASIDRVSFLLDMGERLADVSTVLETLDLGPQDNLIGPLADGRSEFAEQLTDLNERSANYSTMLIGLASFLSDGDYLLLGANNAEMRIASGMHLSIGQMTTIDGGFELSGLVPTGDLVPLRGTPVLDKDVRAQWGFMNPGADFREIAYSPRFDEHVAPQALEMWRTEFGVELDGVIQLDPFVLGALLQVIGGVSIDGEFIGPDDVLPYLLLGQYEEFGDQINEARTQQRQNRLSDLAIAAASAFSEADWDPIDLLQAMRPMAEGRHLLVYSRSETEQAAFAALGIDGSVTDEQIGVFWLNYGASKLDPFLQVSVDASDEVHGELRTVTLRVTTTSSATANLPDYALGPWSWLGIPNAGDYYGRLAFYLPGNARDAVLEPALDIDSHGLDGPGVVLATAPLIVPVGGTKTVSLTFTIPTSIETLSLLPSGRYPSESWSWSGMTFDDSVEREIELSTP